MPELEILEAKVPVRTPVLVKEAETASSRPSSVAGWLSGPVFSRARDIFAANMTELLDRAEPGGSRLGLPGQHRRANRDLRFEDFEFRH